MGPLVSRYESIMIHPFPQPFYSFLYYLSWQLRHFHVSMATTFSGLLRARLPYSEFVPSHGQRRFLVMVSNPIFKKMFQVKQVLCLSHCACYCVITSQFLINAP